MTPAEVARCGDLDALLFEPSSWFCIDARNVKVPGVTPGTLEQALALIARGSVASVVGQLRPGVAGVDIDAEGALGDAAAEALRDWCAARGLWHLLRPSGGGPGRWHLLVVPGVHGDALVDLVARLRRELQISGRHLDLRRQLRPLSAPHRRAGHVTLLPGLEEALNGLRSVLESLPSGARARRATKPGQPAARPAIPRQRTGKGGPPQALTPLPRPRRELPAPWRAYLDRGRAAASAVDRDPSTRSQLELEATFQLVLVGYSEPEAWAAVTSAHASAFPKARSRGRRWWWHVWNRCVADADGWLRSRRGSAATAPIAQMEATRRARAALEALWRSWPARVRHTDYEILSVVLDRMDRVREAAVAVPQRDLVLDCAVASRTTVRAALARLQYAGLLQVEPTYVPGTTDTAHTLRLPERFTSQDSDEDGSAVSLTDPSRFQPPQRRLPLHLRRALGPSTSAVLAHLHLGVEPRAALPALAYAAGLLDPDQDGPSPRQLRTLRGHLRTLAKHGLAEVDEQGRWCITPRPDHADTSELEPTTDIERAGQALDDAVRTRVAVERAEFHERVDPDACRARWDRQRAAALERAAKAARARQKAWWSSMGSDERARRRVAYSTAFAALSPTDQARRKHALAQQRARVGEPECERYSAWLEQLASAELEQRCLDRAAAFAARPRHDQQQLVAAWVEHRARWGLPRHRRPVPQPTPAPPEAVLLQRPVSEVDELALFGVDSAC